MGEAAGLAVVLTIPQQAHLVAWALLGVTALLARYEEAAVARTGCGCSLPLVDQSAHGASRRAKLIVRNSLIAGALVVLSVLTRAAAFDVRAVAALLGVGSVLWVGGGIWHYWPRMPDRSAPRAASG